uniref:(northern house mosquito) hypothetical protein n=1 Tax=Culex pipiens TaxID=7175 RepID=A0A8D8P3U5_CULPI
MSFRDFLLMFVLCCFCFPCAFVCLLAFSFLVCFVSYQLKRRLLINFFVCFVCVWLCLCVCFNCLFFCFYCFERIISNVLHTGKCKKIYIFMSNVYRFICSGFC